MLAQPRPLSRHQGALPAGYPRLATASGDRPGTGPAPPPPRRPRPGTAQALQDIARTYGRKSQRQAAPLVTADVIRIASVCGGSLRGERDRALVLLDFAAAFRRSELTRLRVSDLSFGPHGVSILLPRSKADQDGRGTIVHVAANPLAAHCPVAALRAWLDAAAIRDGWVFRRITRTDAVGGHPLSAESLRLILKERAWEAGCF